MPNSPIQKYFNRVIAWLRNFNIVQRAHYTYLLVKAWRLVRVERLRGGFKDGYVIYVLDPNCKQVMQRAAVSEVDDNGAPKKVWINIRLHAREPIDKFPR